MYTVISIMSLMRCPKSHKNLTKCDKNSPTLMLKQNSRKFAQAHKKKTTKNSRVEMAIKFN